ncbi:MAG: laccase [Treponema sp.]|nr:MAG: laccase [Treponema sp.]
MDNSYISFSFNIENSNNANAKKLPSCILSTLQAGSALPQTKTGITNRKKLFKSLNIDINNILSVKQIHSRNVFATDELKELPDGDGIITCNRSLIPSVVVADCMPVFLFDPVKGCFGVLHSGWAGTGIIADALNLASKRYGAKAENFRVILGPHIRDCCYTITEERAEYFKKNFGTDSISLDEKRAIAGNKWQYRLSLASANLNILAKTGVRAKNIIDTNLCTYCTKKNGDFLFGSHRRQTKELAPDEERKGKFTQMVASVFW